MNLKNINFLLSLEENYCVIDYKDDWQLTILEGSKRKTHFYQVKELSLVYQSSKDMQLNPA